MPMVEAGDYVELRAHTAFSFSDGAVAPEVLAQRARRLGYGWIGITDAADLGGAARLVAEATGPARDAGCGSVALHAELGADDPCPACQRPVRPIIGAELEVDGQPAAFIARTEQGYRNLAALVTLARVGHWRDWDPGAAGRRRGRPGIRWQDVCGHAAGLHALTGPAGGPLAAQLLAGDERAAAGTLGRWRELFGEHLSVEVQLHHVGGGEAALAGALVALAESSGVPWAVTQDPRYVDGAGRLVHDILVALRHGTTVDDAAARGLLRPNGEWCLRSPRTMAQRWAGRPEGLRETRRIAESCDDFRLDWMRPPLPDFGRARGGASDDDHCLRQLTLDGAGERWGASLSGAQRAQLDHELALIARLGFAGFFLVMADAVRFARARGILCQGRGSAANSAVAFCLGITAVDPVQHGLLFERFLSDARTGRKGSEPPDIDVDFEHERREEVLDYMYQRYGRGHAAITGVTQMYRAPNAVQDAMRALGYPVEQALALSRRLHYADPAEGAQTIRDDLAARMGVDVSGARGEALLRAIAGFDGLARLRSTHVGGFVLSARPLGECLPIEQTTMGRTILQFDKDDLDLIGVPKFDFLGLGALTMVRKAFDVIEARTGERPRMYDLPVDDAATYAMISRGETIGTFQIESRAQIASILHTHPSRLYDLVVQVALIRPGPIQARFVHPYTERRLGRQPVSYPHPLLEPILRRTQGIPIFQEQAMAIAMALGGYTGGQADALRRTMGNIRKRDRLVGALGELRTAMLARAARGELDGMTPEIADRICQDLESFANYGFPESHAWSFALIAFATAWLKAHHPTPFYLGLLNAQPMGFYSVATLIHDARRSGVEVRPPCLRHGGRDCTVEETADPARPALRVGWRFVRGVGDRVLDALCAACADRPFASIADVVSRGGLDRTAALALARAGAFGGWAEDRRHAAWEALRASGDRLPLAPGATALHHPVPMDADRMVLLDYYATGLSLAGHPMQLARERLSRGGAVASRDLPGLPGGRTITVGGLVTIRQRPSTANGTIFLLLEDEWGFLNVVVPSQLVPPNEEVVKRALFILVQGRLEKAGGVINLVGRRFRALELGVDLAHRSRDFR
jgi:error-prone DNA polymerase